MSKQRDSRRSIHQDYTSVYKNERVGVKDQNRNEVVLKGVEAVVVFNGARNEKLGQKWKERISGWERCRNSCSNCIWTNKATDATAYTYDVAGNLKTDKNKDITAIRYNFLNLPDSIVITGKGTIKYQYDATGNRVKKTVIEGAKTTTTLYLGGAGFRNDTLEFIDEQFNFVSASSGFEQVGSNNVYTTHARANLTASKNGFLYIHVSNVKDNIDMFFETHIRGPLLEEMHYYPFGLTMAGIRSKGLGFGEPGNNYKFNGIEQNNDFDLNMYDAYFRNLDLQIGRFWQIDPKPNFGESLYSAMSNNPILYSDFLGDTVKYANGAGGEQARQMVTKFTNRTIINKKGKELANKNYNEAFANVINKLDGSADNFVFHFDAKATEGAVTYDGRYRVSFLLIFN